MKRICNLSWILILLIATTGCATRAAPDIKGRWKPVNHYADTPQEIPLYQSYVFYAAPLDGTLKTMLTRWAKDSKMTLSYLHPSDFTLHAQAASVHTGTLQEAIDQLNAAYAAQRVSISVEQNQIIVRSGADPSQSPTGATP